MGVVLSQEVHGGLLRSNSKLAHLAWLWGPRQPPHISEPESQPRRPLGSPVTLQADDSPWPGRMARCSSGSRSPRAGFGGDRPGPVRSGHRCWGKAEGTVGASWGSRAPLRQGGCSSQEEAPRAGGAGELGQLHARGAKAPPPKAPKMPLLLYWGPQTQSPLPPPKQESTLSFT